MDFGNVLPSPLALFCSSNWRILILNASCRLSSCISFGLWLVEDGKKEIRGSGEGMQVKGVRLEDQERKRGGRA